MNILITFRIYVGIIMFYIRLDMNTTLRRLKLERWRIGIMNVGNKLKI
jgi:hypothetical protein